MTDDQIGSITQGAFVFWDPHPTDHARLRETLADVGQEELCPPPHAVGAALKKALADYARENGARMKEQISVKDGGDFIVQRHKSAEEDGYEVVRVTRDKERNDYLFVFSAKADGEQILTESPRYWPIGEHIQRQYDHYRATVSGSGVGKMLTELVGKLHGTCVRTVGGVHYLPEDTVEKWDRVVGAVELAGDTVVTRARVVLDDSSVRTVAMGITKELMVQATHLAEEVKSGELKPDALERRAAFARICREKAKFYEDILGTSLRAVHQALKDAEVAAAATALQLSAV